MNEAQQQALKTAYRKACRLCHPDIVADELKELAHKIMSELNVAKKKNDLARVLEILHALESGESFGVASDTVDDKEQLKAKIADTKEKIRLLELAIAELEASESYQLIQAIDDKEAYFEQLKSQLEEEYRFLEQELRQLKQQLDDIGDEPSQEDWEAYQEILSESDDIYWQDEF